MSTPVGWDDDMAVIRQAMGDAMNAQKITDLTTVESIVDQVTSETAREWLFGSAVERIISESRPFVGVDGDQLYKQHQYTTGFVGRYQGASGRGK